jgi:predicted esterase/predicted HTH domain antitoxin
MTLNFEGMKAGALKSLLRERSISIEGCYDKTSLLERAEQYREWLEAPPAAPVWEGGEPAESGPAGAAASSLILLHGFGDSGDGFISSIGGPLVAMDGLRVIFPSAPIRQIGGYPVSSWLPVTLGAGGPAAVAGTMMRTDAAKAQVAVDYVHALIRREISRGVAAERIVVGGFSQGGLIATRAALSFPDAALGGALALSTFFGSDVSPVAAANQGLRVLVAHGAADNVVPVSEGRRVAASVRRLAPEADVDLREYASMGHSTCPEEVQDLRAFLQQVMAGSPSRQAADVAPRTAAGVVELRAEATEAELQGMSAAGLKAYLRERGVSTADCFEKADLLARARARARDVCG